MVKSKYDDIIKEYDLADYKKVDGVIKDREVEFKKVGEKMTNKVLKTLENVLHTSPQIAGIEKKRLFQIIKPGLTLLTLDKKGKQIAKFNYVCKDLAMKPEYLVITVFGNAIKTASQFNKLGIKLFGIEMDKYNGRWIE